MLVIKAINVMRIAAPGKPANEQILKHDLCSIEKVEVYRGTFLAVLAPR